MLHNVDVVFATRFQDFSHLLRFLNHEHEYDIRQTSLSFVQINQDHNVTVLNKVFPASKACVCKIFPNPLTNDVQMRRVCMALFLWQGFSQSIFCSPPTYGNLLMNCGNVQSSSVDFEKMWS